MKKCCPECIPCCDFCIYSIRDEEMENGFLMDFGPKGCKKHPDEEHQEIARWDGMCNDFHCMNVKEEK